MSQAGDKEMVQTRSPGCKSAATSWTLKPPSPCRKCNHRDIGGSSRGSDSADKSDLSNDLVPQSQRTPTLAAPARTLSCCRFDPALHHEVGGARLQRRRSAPGGTALRTLS